MILPLAPFRFEHQMLAPLADGLPALLGIESKRAVRILREPPLGLIIPDLLLGHWAPAHAPAPFPTTTLIDAHVRALLEEQGALPSRAIAEQLYLSPETARASIQRLARTGALVGVPPAAEAPFETCATDASWAVAPGARTGRVEIVAVEAKLTRWQDAVQQAAAYLEFADRSIMVLDGNRVTRSDAAEEAARRARVGLVMQHGRILRWVVRAAVQPPPLTATRVLALTKLTTARGGRAFRVRAAGRLREHPPARPTASPLLNPWERP